ncbi:MAG: methyltransferase domain-containing protein [Bacteroidota bacterium]
MNTEKILPIAKGFLKHIPGIEKMRVKKTGGTINSRYCYSIWLRHLIHAIKGFHLKSIPVTVAELGPGDSIGIGLAALLTGVENYYALDVYKYWDAKRNLTIFDELFRFIKAREKIPDNKEFPNAKPLLDSYEFPSKILSDKQLKKSLDPKRINEIKKEIAVLDNSSKNKYINYFIPWDGANIIKKGSVDFIYSQAVLEHVEDLKSAYQAMHSWLKQSGIMSHQIDFKSHGITKSWNGHWIYSDFEWKLVKAKKEFLINRAPLTRHIKLHDLFNFNILKKVIFSKKSLLKKQQLAKKFRTLCETDITTSGAYILSTKN